MKCIFYLIVVLLSFTGATAQNFSLYMNLSALNVDNVESDDELNVDYKGRSTISVNMRLYNEKRWAMRLGAGRDNIDFEVGNGNGGIYLGERKDYIGYLGLEKHFLIAGIVDVYPGVVFPLTFQGEQKFVEELVDNFEVDEDAGSKSPFFAGAGLILGANVKFIKVLRIGAEFETVYANFKSEVWDQLGDINSIDLKNMDYKASFVIGFAF